MESISFWIDLIGTNVVNTMKDTDISSDRSDSGKGYSHGGDSYLDRDVPLIVTAPKSFYVCGCL